MIITFLRKNVYQFMNLCIAWKLRTIYKMHIGENTKISRHASLDSSVNPKGIYVGDNTYITGYVIVLAHDASRGVKCDTVIGKNCFIGVAAIIMPGVHLGDETVVGAGSVVTKNFPSNVIIAGNPARIIKQGIRVVNGKIIE